MAAPHGGRFAPPPPLAPSTPRHQGSIFAFRDSRLEQYFLFETGHLTRLSSPLGGLSTLVGWVLASINLAHDLVALGPTLVTARLVRAYVVFAVHVSLTCYFVRFLFCEATRSSQRSSHYERPRVMLRFWESLALMTVSLLAHEGERGAGWSSCTDALLSPACPMLVLAWVSCADLVRVDSLWKVLLLRMQCMVVAEYGAGTTPLQQRYSKLGAIALYAVFAVALPLAASILLEGFRRRRLLRRLTGAARLHDFGPFWVAAVGAARWAWQLLAGERHAGGGAGSGARIQPLRAAASGGGESIVREGLSADGLHWRQAS